MISKAKTNVLSLIFVIYDLRDKHKNNKRKGVPNQKFGGFSDVYLQEK